MEWYYAQNGQQKGPVSQEQLAEIFSSGQIGTSDLVWNDSMTDWAPIGTLPGFQAAEASPEPAPSSDSPPPMEKAPTAPASPAAPAFSDAAPSNRPASTPSTEQVPTYLWQSIVCLVLCCLIGGIVALVYSTKVDPALQAGDVEAARAASKNAKLWCWISFVSGLIINLLLIGSIVVSAIAGAGMEATAP